MEATQIAGELPNPAPYYTIKPIILKSNLLTSMELGTKIRLKAKLTGSGQASADRHAGNG
jgi:hypothetical protein